MKRFFKIMAAIPVVIIAALVALLLAVDPPPLTFSEPTTAVLSVPQRTFLGSSDPIESGLACDAKIEGYGSTFLGRPKITFFDWLKEQSGGPRADDFHFYIEKPKDTTWAIRVDRATKSFCFLKSSAMKAGVSDAYCGMKITREDNKRIVAFEDSFDEIKALYFDKATRVMTLTSLVEWRPAVTTTYFECH